LEIAQIERAEDPKMPSLDEPATPEIHLEVETKLELDAGLPLPDPLQHKGVSRAGLVGVTSPVVHQLDATYFDTDHLDLLRSKVTLRKRAGGDDAGWHLKLPADRTGRAGARTEVRMPLSRGNRIPAQLAELVLGTARGRALKPVARLQNQRTVIRLLDADGGQAVEIADDAVTATRPDSDRTDRWREIEVELIDGSTAQLEATVQALIDAGARPAGRASKLARVLPLLPGTPVRGRSSRSGKSAAAATLTELARYRDKLIASERGLRQGADGAVHDVRADARRIRSVLRVFEGLFADEPSRALRDHLRDLGGVLGAAREVEIVRARLAAGLAEESDARARGAETLIDAELGRRSATVKARVQRELNSAQHLQLLRDLDAFLDDPQLTRRAPRAAATELPIQLGRSWRRVRAKADAALSDPTDAQSLHDVRKAAKTMRYAAESTIPVLGHEAVLFAAALEQVQEVLGEFRDAQITAHLLVDLAHHQNTDGASGFIFGRLYTVEHATALGVIEDFADAWDRVEDADLATALGQD